MAVRMSSPVKGYVSSEYGNRSGGFHAGIDIATGGKPGKVHAAFAGKVIRVVSGRKHGNRSTDSYAPGRTGNYVVVRNPDGERQLYNHTKATVDVGDSVEIGSVLGVTDLSGNTTGYHCHYEEWRVNGRTRDPRISFNAFDVEPGSTPVNGGSPDSNKNDSKGRSTLRRGMSGDDVKELQRALNRFKATPDRRWPHGDLRVDGDYGSYTEARVRDWQTRNHGGLYPRANIIDGVAGPVTMKGLGL